MNKSKFIKPEGFDDFVNEVKPQIVANKNALIDNINSSDNDPEVIKESLKKMNKNSVSKKQVSLRLNEYYRTAALLLEKKEEGISVNVALENVIKEYLDKYLDKIAK
ncbi:MAG: hypothetical protein J0H68_09770 [Sphingobacteriia bacterium]|nr:hypothetical protein [Sphingobacteriia bacterium]